MNTFNNNSRHTATHNTGHVTDHYTAGHYTAGHYAIRIECQKQPEVMERILRVVRHRGFELLAITMNRSDCGERVCADVMVSGSRPLNFLTSQIEKLYDVLSVARETGLEAGIDHDVPDRSSLTV